MSDIYITDNTPEGVRLRARFEGDGGIVGDMAPTIRPGQSFDGVTFDELRKLGLGKFTMEVDGDNKLTLVKASAAH